MWFDLLALGLAVLAFVLQKVLKTPTKATEEKQSASV
ncbi:hypothetical protein J2S78_003098 [Salibacterium salarium]|nr:hypothetical protein [Salibacterium salarium]